MSGLDVLMDERGAPTGDGGELVGVLVSTCNDAELVTSCLTSVAVQTYQPLEIIVVDDASEDGTSAVALGWLREHGDRFVRRRVLSLGRSHGLAGVRNAGFEAADADVVLVLDAGGRIYPRAIARLLEAMRDTAVSTAYPQGLRLGESGEALGLAAAADWAPSRLAVGDYIDTTALVDRRAWAEVGGYSPLCGCEDHDFWCKFVEAGLEGLFVPELLCARRSAGSAAQAALTPEQRRRIAYRMRLAHPWLELRV